MGYESVWIDRQALSRKPALSNSRLKCPCLHARQILVLDAGNSGFLPAGHSPVLGISARSFRIQPDRPVDYWSSGPLFISCKPVDQGA